MINEPKKLIQRAPKRRDCNNFFFFKPYYLLFQKFETMDANENISVCVYFEQISVQSIKPKSSNWEARVIFELFYLLRVAQRDEVVLQ